MESRKLPNAQALPPQAFWFLASLAAMASVGLPPAASQGVASKLAAEHEDADIFNHIKVATYNVGASQDINFTAPRQDGTFQVEAFGE